MKINKRHFFNAGKLPCRILQNAGQPQEHACRFVEQTGKTAVIGALDKIEDILAGKSGTRVVVEKGVIYE